MLTEYTNLQWITSAICGILTGMPKKEISGAELFVIPAMAGISAGKHSFDLLLLIKKTYSLLILLIF